MIGLLLLMTLSNYKSYCLNNTIRSDTSIIMRYKNIDGIFFDKEALIRIGKKTSGFDSLKVINILNQSIIKRQEESLFNCNQIEGSFNQYVKSKNEEINQINKKHNLKTIGRNITDVFLGTSALILGLIVLLK